MAQTIEYNANQPYNEGAMNKRELFKKEVDISDGLDAIMLNVLMIAGRNPRTYNSEVIGHEAYQLP